MLAGEEKKGKMNYHFLYPKGRKSDCVANKALESVGRG